MPADHTTTHDTTPVTPIPRPPDPRLRAAWDALATVIDPELGLDIVSLGLVYDVGIVDDVVRVTHTLTTPGCPMERVITQGVMAALGTIDGVRGAETRLVWDPAWHAGMIAEGAWTR